MNSDTMLIQYTPFSQLDEATKQRLKTALMAGLAHCDEARNHGYVVFEGHALRITEVTANLMPQQTKKILLG